jgi:hypothetical protein
VPAADDLSSKERNRRAAAADATMQDFKRKIAEAR